MPVPPSASSDSRPQRTIALFDFYQLLGIQVSCCACFIPLKLINPLEKSRQRNLISNKGWTINDDEASGTNCTLPVRLISFTGQQQGNTVLLNWKTAGEENNAGFEIERSADVRKFEIIGFVDGSGDANEVRKYDFTDPNPFATSYYRLKQIDREADRS